MKRPQVTQEIIDANYPALTETSTHYAANLSSQIIMSEFEKFLSGERTSISHNELAAIIFRAIRETNQI